VGKDEQRKNVERSVANVASSRSKSWLTKFNVPKGIKKTLKKWNSNSNGEN
jgi:hypothetical protein